MAKVEYKYNSKTMSIARRYLEMCNEQNMKLPTVEGLALELKVNDDTLNEWGKLHPSFKRIMTELKMRQKEQLINNGMYGGKEINVAMFIFLLKNNHGMREKVDNTTDDKPISFQIVSYQKTAHE